MRETAKRSHSSLAKLRIQGERKTTHDAALKEAWPTHHGQLRGSSPNHVIHICETEVQSTKGQGLLQLLSTQCAASICVYCLEPLRANK